MANVLKNRVLTLCDLAEQWGSIYKFFSFCDLSNLEVNYLHSCPSLAWPERPLSPVASGPHTHPTISRITNNRIKNQFSPLFVPATIQQNNIYEKKCAHLTRSFIT